MEPSSYHESNPSPAQSRSFSQGPRLPSFRSAFANPRRVSSTPCQFHADGSERFWRPSEGPLANEAKSQIGHVGIIEQIQGDTRAKPAGHDSETRITHGPRNLALMDSSTIRSLAFGVKSRTRFRRRLRAPKGQKEHQGCSRNDPERGRVVRCIRLCRVGNCRFGSRRFLVGGVRGDRKNCLRSRRIRSTPLRCQSGRPSVADADLL